MGTSRVGEAGWEEGGEGRWGDREGMGWEGGWARGRGQRKEGKGDGEREGEWE